MAVKEGYSIFNTSIKSEVLDKFREICTAQGVKMNYVVERFMMQFNSGEFELVVKKVNGEKECKID